MSTVKIKTEPTTAATAAAVNAQVKLEPTLSTADIKLEQHTSGIDTKVESDSDIDSEEGEEEDDIKSESDDGDADQNQRRWVCEYPRCGLGFNSSSYLRLHQHEHNLQTELYFHGKSYILTRQSLNDRWPCPVLDCNMTYKTTISLRRHIRRRHGSTVRQQQQQQSPSQYTRHKHYFLGVDDFYVNDTRCGYHNTMGLFICHECRLVPECLLTHLQQKHGYHEKLIDNSALPESAVTANADPNTNQHIGNSYLTSAIGQSSQLQHRDIMQGWLCVTSDCSYCGCTVSNRIYHKRVTHQGEPMSTVPALVLRLAYAKTQTNYFLITRIDQVTASNNRVGQHKPDYSHNGLDAQDDSGNKVDQNETTDILGQKRQWRCEYPNCKRIFNSSDKLSIHRREHRLDVVLTVKGNTFTLSRQSSADRWACPVSNCEIACKTICTAYVHLRDAHSTLMDKKRVKIEDDDSNQQQRQQNIKKARPAINCLNVDDFHTGGARCGYHSTTGLFLCYTCRLVPECLLTHLQQSHGFDEKSIENALLPESASITGNDPNGNQYTSNPYLASAISQSSQLRHRDIVKGWLCVKSDCGYCGYPINNKDKHKKTMHKDEQLLTAPALVLRLRYGKVQTTCFFITRLDTATDSTVEPSHSTSQQINEFDDDDGDELVLSDYSD